MTRFWLVRHGTYAMIDRGLGGRDDHALGEAGLAEAQRVAAHLADQPIAAVVTSPVRRARETASPLAGRLGLAPRIEPDFAEIDFAGWTGRHFADLADDPAWHAWNAFRSTAAVPGGETMLEVQSRAIAALRRLRAETPEATIAIFSHGDVIKSVLLHFLGAPLDLMQRLHIAPASLSLVELGAEQARILNVNLPP